VRERWRERGRENVMACRERERDSVEKRECSDSECMLIWLEGSDALVREREKERKKERNKERNKERER
jgi:gluconate kinase